jgi:hypothetical protein
LTSAFHVRDTKVSAAASDKLCIFVTPTSLCPRDCSLGTTSSPLGKLLSRNYSLLLAELPAIVFLTALVELLEIISYVITLLFISGDSWQVLIDREPPDCHPGRNARHGPDDHGARSLVTAPDR